MKLINKRIISLLLALVVRCGMMPMTAFATEGIEVVHEHNYETMVTDSTCAEQGYTIFTCECGDSYVDNYVDATGHTYENGICTGCGEAQPGPVIAQQPESVQQEIGKKFTITVKAEGEGLTYQWYYKESYMKDFKPSSNKTFAYTYSMQSYMNERSVYCIITDKFGNQVQTEVVTIHLEK